MIRLESRGRSAQGMLSGKQSLSSWKLEASRSLILASAHDVSFRPLFASKETNCVRPTPANPAPKSPPPYRFVSDKKINE